LYDDASSSVRFWECGASNLTDCYHLV
jgi:hypothetical protein